MYKDILFPVDLNDDSSWEKALPTALEYCRAFKARLHIMTAVPDFGNAMVASFFPKDFEEKTLAETGQRLHEFVSSHVPDSIPVQHIVAHGSPYQEILRVAGEIGCDLILMASHRPELKDYLIGPNADRVVCHADCSVLVVRG
jgi:nucleotide-binding universal stress UspA family protein